MATRSVTSGPWSLEWLKDHVHGEAGVVSSSKYVSKPSTSKTLVDSSANIKMKARGSLKHPLHNVKKIARLPDHDRKLVLKILMKKRRRKVANLVEALPFSIPIGPQTSDSSSSASVNNDWKNWVVLKGKEEELLNDVKDFGKTLGVKFYNDKCNQFRLLSRGRKQNKEVQGGPKTGAHSE
jgi:hypothetical protein